MHLQENAVIPIYYNWQNEVDCIGTAILIEKVKGGYTFIVSPDQTTKLVSIKPHITEQQTSVYSYERWKVQFVEVTTLGKKFLNVGDIKSWNIRFLYNVGLTSSTYKEERDLDLSPYIQDKFLTVDGVEVF